MKTTKTTAVLKKPDMTEKQQELLLLLKNFEGLKKNSVLKQIALKDDFTIQSATQGFNALLRKGMLYTNRDTSIVITEKGRFFLDDASSESDSEAEAEAEAEAVTETDSDIRFNDVSMLNVDVDVDENLNDGKQEPSISSVSSLDELLEDSSDVKQRLVYQLSLIANNARAARGSTQFVAVIEQAIDLINKNNNGAG